MCDAKDVADDNADSKTWYWSAMGIKSMESFNLVPNICHKEKWDGVGSREGKDWWLK